ncbi:matrixin family metalloprotease [Limosilactobacillus agrestis]|uniref:matrixin family metalloprotease n=1 Tax=Limosilactobacillus agrestis TaxID=2759748 RepID=UPI001E51E71B|nr:matrixin family metalloprotease [Limosilactobacillus agrestis]
MLTQSWLHRITGKEVATPIKQNADQQIGTQDTPTDARWQQNSATIYINISNPVLKNATETAITQWNNTKAFTFKVVNDKDANISVSAVNDPNNGAAGLTNTSMNSATGYYLHATVELNSYYLLNPAFGYSQERIVNTAEHELGHAIGLQHTNKISVMQPAGSYYSIQLRDIQAVKALYSRTPQPSIAEDNPHR